MKTLDLAIKLIITLVLFNSTLFSQLDLTIYTDKDVYEYGETINLYAKVTNPADTTFEFLAGNYESCQAEFSFNDFNSWEYTACLTLAELLTFKPHNSKIYSWRIEPQRLGLPNKDGIHTIIGTYYFDLADTIYIQAPKYFGGEVELSYNVNNFDSINAISNNLNADVVFGNDYGEIKSEVWQIEGYDIDSLIQLYSNDSIFVSFEKSIWISYENIVDENSLDYYPLQIGNKWFYHETGIAYELEPIIVNNTYTEEITNDSIDNNGIKYFYVQSDNISYWLRIDSSTGYVYKKYSLEDLESLAYSLTYQSGFELETDNGILYDAVDQDSILWEDFRHLKTQQLYSLYTHQITFAEGLGIINKLNSFDFGNTEVKLLGCLINGKMYGDTTIVGIQKNRKEIPTQFSLSQNYPNPFNPTTTIEYTIPYVVDANFASTTKVILYDILGKEVTTLVNEIKNPGIYQVTFNVSNLSSGVYYYRLTTGKFSVSKKMIMLK